MAGRSAVPALRSMFMLLLLLALLQPALYTRLLPARVAAWFGLDGNPLLFVERTWLLGGVAAGALAIGLLVLVILPRLMPASDPGSERLLRFGLWGAIVTTAFLMSVVQLVFDTNARTVPRLPMTTLGWLAASYAGFVGVWAWALRRGGS
jgi:hypothetical protein